MMSLTSTRWHKRSRWSVRLALVVLAFALVTPSGSARSAQAGSPSFASPEQAFDRLVGSIRNGDTGDLIKVLGPESRPLVTSGDPTSDRQIREKFMAAYTEANKIVREGDDRAVLLIGKDEWPFPIPAVKSGAAWRFDTKAGKEEILNRRIGANELETIDVCLAYVDAQREYATKDRNHDGFIEYAQKFLSSPGKMDGLYWPAASGEEQSPMGPLMVQAQSEGYVLKQGQQTPYHGYYFKILKGQGAHATGGVEDYVVKGHMIGGFALVAFPAQYGASGIMTFIVNHEGVVYQHDFGPNTPAIVARIVRFDPGPGWTILK